MAKNKSRTIYTCQNCGSQRTRWEGKCSDCGSWNSFVEETYIESAVSNRGWALGSPSGASYSQLSSDPKKLESFNLEKASNENLEGTPLNPPRMFTHINELNRVLGGGLTRGSLTLIGGAPGIGKSTLLLQMAEGLAKEKHRVLYISGEESIQQTLQRAQRLNVKSGLIELASFSDVHRIIELTQKIKPDVLIVDSIQTIFLPEINSAPGSVSQVRESAGHLMSLAKNENYSIILVGHVTKEGNLAGPKVLEHMVDTVLSFEGDLSYQFRLLRSLKNRFGPTHELGVFQMNSMGLQEVQNPSELFLQERGESLVGSAIFSSLEGTRPLLCEIQALAVSTPMAMPRRTSLGVDINRLHLLIAVIERHLNIPMYQLDIFVNVVGGLKLSETGSDVGVMAALLSAESRISLDAKTCFMGEIGLTGEVRAVSLPELRIKEAHKLGFKKAILPFSNKKSLEKEELPKGIELSYIKNIHDLKKLLKNNSQIFSE